MESKGRFVLLGLLLILAALCQSGHSLRCYSCIKPALPCITNITCSANFNTCLVLHGAGSKYFQCWVSHECDYESLSERFGESNLKYHCCQRDLCNKDTDLIGGKAGRTTPLVAPLLAVAWRLCL